MKNLVVTKQAKLHPTENTIAPRKCLILCFEAYLSQQKLSWFYLFLQTSDLCRIYKLKTMLIMPGLLFNFQWIVSHCLL